MTTTRKDFNMPILSHTNEEMLKNQLTSHIIRQIELKGLTQLEAATLLKTTQPEISKLKKGNHQRFRLERLFSFLNCLGISVDIYLTEAKNDPYQRIVVL